MTLTALGEASAQGVAWAPPLVPGGGSPDVCATCSARLTPESNFCPKCGQGRAVPVTQDQPSQSRNQTPVWLPWLIILILLAMLYCLWPSPPGSTESCPQRKDYVPPQPAHQHNPHQHAQTLEPPLSTKKAPPHEHTPPQPPHQHTAPPHQHVPHQHYPEEDACLPADANPSDHLFKDCLTPGDVYQGQQVCSQENRNKWKGRAAANPESESKDACRVDFSTGQILCDTLIKCHGGERRCVHKQWKNYTMEYDCSQCRRGTHASCCEKCDNLQAMVPGRTLKIGGDQIEAVHCHGCQAKAFDVSPNVSCQLNPDDGKFSCVESEHCATGFKQKNEGDSSFTCVVTPCDECQDRVARGVCCQKCLEAYCDKDRTPLSFRERKVCKGCDYQ